MQSLKRKFLQKKKMFFLCLFSFGTPFLLWHIIPKLDICTHIQTSISRPLIYLVYKLGSWEKSKMNHFTYSIADSISLNKNTCWFRCCVYVCMCAMRECYRCVHWALCSLLIIRKYFNMNDTLEFKAVFPF